MDTADLFNITLTIAICFAGYYGFNAGQQVGLMMINFGWKIRTTKKQYGVIIFEKLVGQKQLSVKITMIEFLS